jgi:hypothetical protein
MAKAMRKDGETERIAARRDILKNGKEADYAKICAEHYQR